MKIRPIQNRILVKRDPPTDKTPGGLFIPDNAKEKLTKGTVIAAGRGKLSASGYFVETTLKAGDRIVFGKYSGSEVENRGEDDMIFMSEDEILGVIEEE
jgi:chaperonin GroES